MSIDFEDQSIEVRALMNQAKRIFEEWKQSDYPARKEYRERRSTPAKDQKLLADAFQFVEPGSMFVFAHIDRALAESKPDYPMQPLPSNRPTKEDLRTFQELTREELILLLHEQGGSRSRLARCYRWACANFGFQDVVLEPPSIPVEEIKDFERQVSAMTPTERRRRYEREPQFRQFADAAEQLRNWERDKPLAPMSAADYRRIPAIEVARKFTGPDGLKFRAQISMLRRKGQI
jgi:hypothetical protein